MTKPGSPVTLQITLAPSDFRHAQVLLPHQVRTWREQVSEILLTVDFHRSAGRFSERWAEGEKQILPLAQSIEGARVVTVDYSSPARSRVSTEFFGGQPVPAKDYRGGPCYSYFFGLAVAEHDHVLHTDSDMFFGGGSPTWLAEALGYFETHPNTLLMAPLSGPPQRQGGLRYLKAKADPTDTNAYLFDVMSTRLFLISRSRFRGTVGSLNPRRPPGLRQNLIALLEGNPLADLPEHWVTEKMRALGLTRREFLGRAPGMWSLHPPYRGSDFFQKLPELVRRIESGDVPDEQRGDHDLNDSMVDWTEPRRALRKNRLWHRLWARWFK